jgi:hypothetical protein
MPEETAIITLILGKYPQALVTYFSSFSTQECLFGVKAEQKR